jgi:hypothetical protein
MPPENGLRRTPLKLWRLSSGFSPCLPRTDITLSFSIKDYGYR